MTSMKMPTESLTGTVSRAGAAASTAAQRMGGELRRHGQEMLILLGTLGFAVVAALLGLLLLAR